MSSSISIVIKTDYLISQHNNYVKQGNEKKNVFHQKRSYQLYLDSTSHIAFINLKIFYTYSHESSTKIKNFLTLHQVQPFVHEASQFL